MIHKYLTISIDALLFTTTIKSKRCDRVLIIYRIEGLYEGCLTTDQQSYLKLVLRSTLKWLMSSR